MIERVLKIGAGMQALMEESIAEIGPIALRGAAERCVLGVRSSDDDGVVVRDRRQKNSRVTSRDDYHPRLDALAVERGRNLLRRQFGRAAGKLQSKAGLPAMRRHH